MLVCVWRVLALLHVHALGAAGMSISQRLVNRHAAVVGITRCGLLAIDEARLCLCVRRLAAGTGPTERLVNRHATVFGHCSV